MSTKCICIPGGVALDDVGGQLPEVLPCPWHMLELVSKHKRKHGIWVDHCIADQIRMLWSEQVTTYACCCGHNNRPPSVVVEEVDSVLAKRLLMERDPGREWQVMYWHHELRERKA